MSLFQHVSHSHVSQQKVYAVLTGTDKQFSNTEKVPSDIIYNNDNMKSVVRILKLETVFKQSQVVKLTVFKQLH